MSGAVDVKAGIVLENCRIVDGSGRPARFGSVGLRGSSIEAVGHVERERYRERIDADGQGAAPAPLHLFDPPARARAVVRDLVARHVNASARELEGIQRRDEIRRHADLPSTK